MQTRHSTLDGQHGKATQTSDNLRQISPDNRNGTALKSATRVILLAQNIAQDIDHQFMLLHEASSTVLLGAGYTAKLEAILEFMERERIQ
jgi:hypothetical protein